MRLETDVARGAWLLRRAGTLPLVDGAVGGGFAAYARILHPVTATLEDRLEPDARGDHPERSTTTWTWAQVAERTDGTMHPLVQWPRLTGVDDASEVPLPDGWRVSPPEAGWFDPSLLPVLAGHLAASTTTPEDLVAGFWSGWGDLNGGMTVAIGWERTDEESTTAEGAALLAQAEAEAEARAAEHRAFVASLSGPRLAWPGRGLVLTTTRCSDLADPARVDRALLGTYLDVGHTPQLLWPQDHTWAVATEIDWDSTLVAGARDLVDAVLADPRLEAFEVGEHDDLSWSGDRVNRRPRPHAG